MIRVLLVEDDRSIVEHLTYFLEKEGFSVKSTDTQAAALKLVQNEPFDLALLDISLKEGNGFSLCSAIKAEKELPVIFLTASGDEYSTVTGFDLGAEDYIPKPFRPRELVSRIKNVLRLCGKVSNTFSVNDVTVDTIRGTVTKKGQDVNLSALEYRLLLTLLNHRGAVLSRSQLLETIWDVAGDFVNDNTLTVYIKRLREKIEDDPQKPQIIQTIRGLGYRVDK